MVVDYSTAAESARRRLEAAILATHGRYSSGKIPSKVLVVATHERALFDTGTKPPYLDRVRVTYQDKSERVFQVLAPAADRATDGG